MKVIHRETPYGTVLEIMMQTFRVDCSECGREDIDPKFATTERIEFEDGTAGHRPLCFKCARRLGIECHAIDQSGATP